MSKSNQSGRKGRLQDFVRRYLWNEESANESMARQFYRLTTMQRERLVGADEDLNLRSVQHCSETDIRLSIIIRSTFTWKQVRAARVQEFTNKAVASANSGKVQYQACDQVGS